MDGTQLKPSEALRKGAVGMRRCKGQYIKRNEAGKVYACCGVGALAIGSGDTSLVEPQYLNGALPKYLLDIEVFDPVAQEQRPLIIALQRMNDNLNWSFNKQAAYLEKHGL